MSIKLDVLEATFSALRSRGVEFFLNGHSEPTVSIPDDPCQIHWPVEGQRFADLIISTFHEIAKPKRLSRVELLNLLALIREECRSGGTRYTELDGMKIEDLVITQGVWCLLNSSPIITLKTEDLRIEISKLQSLGRITTEQLVTPFTNVFSLRLGRLIKPLRSRKIDVEIKHRDDGSHTSLRRLEGFVCEPAAVPRVMPTTDDADGIAAIFPSGLSAFTGRDLPPTDGNDGEFRYEKTLTNP